MMRHKAAVLEQEECDSGNQSLHVIGLWTAQDESRQRLRSAIANAMKVTRDGGEVRAGGAPTSMVNMQGLAQTTEASSASSAASGASGASVSAGVRANGSRTNSPQKAAAAAYGDTRTPGSPLRDVNVFSFSETDADADTPATPTHGVAAGTSAPVKLLSPSEMRKMAAQKVASAS